MNYPGWQGAESARRANQAARESGRLAGAGGGGCLVSTFVALMIVVGVLVMAAPVAWRILG